MEIAVKVLLRISKCIFCFDFNRAYLLPQLGKESIYFSVEQLLLFLRRTVTLMLWKTSHFLADHVALTWSWDLYFCEYCISEEKFSSSWTKWGVTFLGGRIPVTTGLQITPAGRESPGIKLVVLSNPAVLGLGRGRRCWGSHILMVGAEEILSFEDCSSVLPGKQKMLVCNEDQAVFAVWLVGWARIA